MPNRIISKVSRPPLDLVDIIHEVAKIAKIEGIKFSIGFGSEDEMDFILGDVYKVTIRGYRDGQRLKRQFVIKWIADPERRYTFRNLYIRDHAFYNYVAPKLIEIQRRFKIVEGLKISFPNCVFSRKEKHKECMVFTCILSQGYGFSNRVHSIDVEHCSLVIKCLAKLHGLFYVLKHTDERQSNFIKMIYHSDVQYSGKIKPTSNCIFNFYNESVSVVKDPMAKNKLNNCAEDIYNILCKCVIPDRFSTICHADCWSNNVCFKYNGTKPIDVILVDYQISRFASPVTDLSYFLYMSTDEELLENHYERLINLYYKTLSAVLRQCNVNVNEIYPEDIFQEHLKKYSVLGLIEALISMKIITAESEDAIEMAKMRYDIVKELACDSESQNESLFVKRVNGVVNDFFKRGYSLDAVLEK
ncbi:uncharacterized protein LOC106140731 isoform X1 [Amyelois transitella]|uniref:uncharacterized protein LOC106140731 isoform X1 n=1 Tax=Amyelois transitella TaxID=680683 RepID=UPI00298F9B2B|nr:uncharacterized protein LOC106140731 isoform X1 [Amyelois transitella]